MHVTVGHSHHLRLPPLQSMSTGPLLWLKASVVTHRSLFWERSDLSKICITRILKSHQSIQCGFFAKFRNLPNVTLIFPDEVVKQVEVFLRTATLCKLNHWRTVKSQGWNGEMAQSWNHFGNVNIFRHHQIVWIRNGIYFKVPHGATKHQRHDDCYANLLQRPRSQPDERKSKVNRRFMKWSVSTLFLHISGLRIAIGNPTSTRKPLNCPMAISNQFRPLLFCWTSADLRPSQASCSLTDRLSTKMLLGERLLCPMFHI